MSLNQRIAEDLKQAMKAKDSIRLSCLRMVRSSSKNLQVEKRRELTDGEIQSVVSSLVRNGTREDLSLKEEKEIEIFYEYLPQQLTPEKIEETVRQIIAELSAESPKDVGNVMKAAMARMAGQVQGKEVNEIAKKLLTS